MAEDKGFAVEKEKVRRFGLTWTSQNYVALLTRHEPGDTNMETERGAIQHLQEMAPYSS